MLRYILAGVTSSEGIDKNFNPVRTRIFYNNYKDKKAVLKIVGEREIQGYSHIIKIYVDAFAENAYMYMRNRKKYYFNVFVLDLSTQQMYCFDIKTLLDYIKNGAIKDITYTDGILTLSVHNFYYSNAEKYDFILAKTKEFDNAFSIKAKMMKKPFFVIRLEAVNGVEDFHFDYQDYESYEKTVEMYTTLLNSSFTLGFYTKDAVRVATITTSYFQFFFLYVLDEGIRPIFEFRNGIATSRTCYFNHAFEFMCDGNKVYLARQSESKLETLSSCSFFVERLEKQSSVKKLDLSALVELGIRNKE